MRIAKLCFFYSSFPYSHAEKMMNFITVVIEKYDSVSNDDNEDNDGDGKNDDSSSFSTNGFLISSKAYLHTDTTTALPKL